MKKTIFRFMLALTCIAGFGLSSCSDDDDPFVLRNTDEMSFSYAASTQNLTVCTNGKWSVQAQDETGASIDWITFSATEGQGDGETRENVGVNVARNSGVARVGYVHLYAAGKDLTMTVSQEEGTLIYGNVYITGSLYKDVALEDADLVLAYSRATVGAPINAQVSVSGAGADGISVAPLNDNFEEEAGELHFVLTGTPTALGEVIFTFSENGQTIATLNSVVEERSNADPIGTVYFEEHFDRLVWGGDYINNLEGIKGVNANKTSLPDEETKTCTASTDGTGSLVATMNAEFVASRGLTDWSGDKVYERPGYIKISTASGLGKLITPSIGIVKETCPAVLKDLEGKVNIRVSFKASCWEEGSVTEIWVTALNAGTVRVKEVPGLVAREWNTYSVEIDGATAETNIQFTSPDGTAAAKGRFFLDDIKIEKIK